MRLGDTPEKRLVPPPPKVVVVALRNRLGAAIAKDWLAAAGQAVGRHSTDARASAARPSSVEEFQERWGSVSEVSDGKYAPPTQARGDGARLACERPPMGTSKLGD